MKTEEKDLSLDDATAILNNLRGEEGILGLDSAIDQAVENRKAQIASLQGEIRGFLIVKRLVGAIAEKSGLTKLQAPTTSGMIPQAEADNKVAEELSEEVKTRIANKKCAYKAPRSEGGKWCRRSLTSKAEQNCGYCKVHMVALGFSKDKDEE